MQVAPETSTSDLRRKFPNNRHVQRLLTQCAVLRVKLAPSPVAEQWLYHPEQRTIYVWEPDLEAESLSFLVVILAHELGHAMDFDAHPDHIAIMRNRCWSDAPSFIERRAFIRGFRILQDLRIPISLHQYVAMIAEPMATSVLTDIERNYMCSLQPEPTTFMQASGASSAEPVPSSA